MVQQVMMKIANLAAKHVAVVIILLIMKPTRCAMEVMAVAFQIIFLHSSSNCRLYKIKSDALISTTCS